MPLKVNKSDRFVQHDNEFFSSIAIGKAFSVLSDPKKREQYDQYGQAMEPQHNRGGHTGGRQQYYYEEDDDFSAEEIFNMFFGQGRVISEKIK